MSRCTRYALCISLWLTKWIVCHGHWKQANRLDAESNAVGRADANLAADALHSVEAASSSLYLGMLVLGRVSVCHEA